ncbi:MAG TPA: TetR family transcriptional regulator [Ilumatobacteraceae bacterium]
MAKRGSIDRAAVLDAALRVARRVGLDGLSMRMVAEELGVSPMAAYRHIPNRETLVSLAADQLASTIDVPDPDSGPWDERLVRLERAAFRAGIEVPGQVDTTVLTWGPNHRRMLDSILSILVEAGFDETDLAIAFELIWAYFLGQIRIHEHLVSLGEGAVEGPTTNSYPVLAGVINRVPSVSPVEYFERGFQILLMGLRAQLEAKRLEPLA